METLISNARASSNLMDADHHWDGDYTISDIIRQEN